MGKSKLSHAYDSAENKRSARESDVAKGRQPNRVGEIESTVGGTGHHSGNANKGVHFKLPEDAAVTDHSVVTRAPLKE